ncbi:class I SAM-dependent methyltransferase [Pasteurella skyensis]|uniref:Class I SAM-dependent methyltransferase n=1 Tax=Phocoenobacter skyensis TaxID=97481 RepID=A0AAJ6P3A1_9PAST|nr:class I SAM-dependent methyltransferase [Pasteurella skyensis]MDP8171329.1 class I SAM-dependent methyltransferase [Pasteurella skyensis]MDP8175548.1 class I SAM-dependent methyltransferase [Pasteurella skyensis]
MKTSIYDTPAFFERYQQLRTNPISLNEIIEKPTMFSLLLNLKNKRILDLGCGTEEHLYYYLQQGAEYVSGLDLSQSMLNQAAQNFAKNRINPTAYSLHCLPMEELDKIQESNFDIITSSFAFHYIEDFSALLLNIKEKLTPKGILIFSQEHPIVTAHKNGERWEKNNKKQQIAYRLNHYRDEGERERNWFKQPFKTYHRTMATILNQLIITGFEIEKIEEPMLTEQPQWHNEFKDLLHRPPLLFIKARLK